MVWILKPLRAAQDFLEVTGDHVKDLYVSSWILNIH